MSIKFVEQTPDTIRYFAAPDDPVAGMTEKEIEDVAEVFQTPLTGAYNWDYATADGRIRKLYRLGKELNWNQEKDLDWSQNYPRDQPPVDQGFNPFIGYEPFERMSDEDKLRFSWHNQSWTLSQFLHGEQGALLVASQLASCAPSFDAKLYAASQTFDEARHVETFNRYLQPSIFV